MPPHQQVAAHIGDLVSTAANSWVEPDGVYEPDLIGSGHDKVTTEGGRQMSIGW